MRIILILAFVITNLSLWAQGDSTKTQGEIITGEIVIEKDNKILLPQADKIYIRSTPKNFANQPVEISFQVNEPSFQWPDYKSEVPFKSLKESYPKENYQNYVKLGYGNYSSPLVEVGLFKTLSAFDTQAKLFYESFKSGPINGDNSGSAAGGVDLAATYKKELFSITPAISFKNSQYSFYGNSDRFNSGFDTSEPDEISLNEFSFNVELTGGKDDVRYTLKPSFFSTNQNLIGQSGLNEETDLGISGSLDYKVDDAFKTGFNVDANMASYSGGLEIDRSLININPWLTHSRDNLSIKAGFQISSGKVGGNSKTGFYPNARVNYGLNDKWSVYGLLSGGQKWNNLGQLINENQFLDDSLAIVQSEYTLQFGGGFKGTPIKNVLLDASLIYSSVEGLPFYIPSSSDSSRYTLAYDTESVGVVTLQAGLSFMPNTTSTYGVNIEINGYSTESLDRPWHKPAYIFKAFTSHNIQEKLIVSAYLTSMGGIRGPANVDFGYVKLPAFTDLGLGAKYLITARASAFIDVNNLLNSEYERYLGYPTRGITFKLGGQYRF